MKPTHIEQSGLVCYGAIQSQLLCVCCTATLVYGYSHIHVIIGNQSPLLTVTVKISVYLLSQNFAVIV